MSVGLSTSFVISPYCAALSLHLFFFFFSSRRRHTRCSRDWSSDVCSSDLEFELLVANDAPNGTFRSIGKFQTSNAKMMSTGGWQDFKFPPVTAKYLKVRLKIGRASCRERV